MEEISETQGSESQAWSEDQALNVCFAWPAQCGRQGEYKVGKEGKREDARKKLGYFLAKP